MKRVKIFNEYYMAIGKKLKISSTEKITVICFENDFSEEYYLKLLDQECIDKVILIGVKPKNNFGKKLIVANNIKESFVKKSKRVTFLINTDIDEEVLIPLVKLFRIAKKMGIAIGIDNIVGFSSEASNELMKVLEALLQQDLYAQYEKIYDYLCDELDKKFADNSICQFKDNRCIANRKYYNKDKTMGCCYSFKYNGLYFSNIKVCEHQNEQSCNIKCLACKLFTCEYLRERGIRFSLEKMPIALAFFNKKQRDILRTTFFAKKEVVIGKIMKK